VQQCGDVRGYTLLDFGVDLAGGGRLERWGDVVLARPDSRAAEAARLDPATWAAADATFEGRIGGSGGGGGRWRTGRPLPDRWPIEHAGCRFLVGCAPSGHTGLFPEQAAHWAWMADRLGPAGPDAPAEVLNLFAYTGGASVALAKAGARVTHVDASRPAIGWARENAALNGVSTIRWIQEDARRFVDREGRRGRRYDGLLLDPPAFGRGPGGDWQLDRDLAGLLEAAVALLRPEPAFVLVNAYSGGLEAGSLERLLGWALDGRPETAPLATEAGTLWLPAADGRELATGVYARATWTRRDGASSGLP
jgi:23S rRNA (cytosine1962-C5)-methyltransferase